MARLRFIDTERSTNPTTILSTGLDSLADGAGALSSAISNDAADELDLYGDFEFVLDGTIATPTADLTLDLYLVMSVDGTNFMDNVAEGRPADGWRGSFPVDDIAGNQRIGLERRMLSHDDWKAWLVNNIGLTLHSSGNTLKGNFYGLQSV